MIFFYKRCEEKSAIESSHSKYLESKNFNKIITITCTCITLCKLMHN